MQLHRRSWTCTSASSSAFTSVLHLSNTSNTTVARIVPENMVPVGSNSVPCSNEDEIASDNEDGIASDVIPFYYEDENGYVRTVRGDGDDNGYVRSLDGESSDDESSNDDESSDNESNVENDNEATEMNDGIEIYMPDTDSMQNAISNGVDPNSLDALRFLQYFVFKSNLSQANLKILLSYWRKYEAGLPMDPRTIVNLDSVTVEKLTDDQVYIGILKCLSDVIKTTSSRPAKIQLSFNFDGLPLSGLSMLLIFHIRFCINI